jgi:integrase
MMVEDLVAFTCSAVVRSTRISKGEEMSPKRTSHRGVLSLGDGRYELRLVRTDPKTGRRRDSKRIVEAPSALDAARQRMAILGEMRRERAAPARVRLADYARSWLLSRAPAWKASTRKTVAEILDLHVVPVLGDHLMDAITIDDITAWRDGMTTAAAAESVNGRLRVLKKLLKDAVTDRVLEWNPADSVKPLRVLRPDATEIEARGLTAEELRAVLAWLERYRPQWYTIVAAMAWTGLRFGEVSALRWEDLDVERGVLTIRRSQWKQQIQDPKTAAARRTVAIATPLAKALRAHRKRQLAEQSKGVASGYVFLSRKGTLLFQSSLTKPVREALAASGVKRRITAAHGFRHTLNNLIRHVTDEIARQSIIGHADEASGARYSHVGLEEKKAAVAAVVRMVRK